MLVNYIAGVKETNKKFSNFAKTKMRVNSRNKATFKKLKKSQCVT